MLLLDCKKGVANKKNYKHVFFCYPLLEIRKREKRRERPKVNKNTTIFTLFFGGLKNWQEVVPPFGAPKFQFVNLLKTLFLKRFQEKLVVVFF